MEHRVSSLAEGHRLLAAIMVTDAVGFSTRMSVDEELTLRLIDRDLKRTSDTVLRIVVAGGLRSNVIAMAKTAGALAYSHRRQGTIKMSSPYWLWRSRGEIRMSEFKRGYGRALPFIPPERLNQTRQALTAESELDWAFMVMVVGACLIATFGLLANSAAVIIGAMLVAPLMLPIRGAAFGILDANQELIRKGVVSLGVGSGAAIAISMALGYLTGIATFGSEVMARTQPNLLDLGVAITAGALASFAAVDEKISSSFAGVAIAVALMPPLCVIGLWLSQGEWSLALGATLLYLTNLFGITLACMIAFVSKGYAPLQQAHRPIVITLIFTALLVIPLGASTLQLLRQNRLETSLRQALVDRTLTFQKLSLVDMTVNWLSSPPEVMLTVRAAEPVSPNQVELLEAFVAREMGRPFKLHFWVTPLVHVTSETSPMEAWQDSEPYWPR